MTGACAGGGSGAGIGFALGAVGGVGAPNSTLGLRAANPAAPRPAPPRAKLAVDASTQVTANTAAKTRCMVLFLLRLPHARKLIIPQQATSSVLPAAPPSSAEDLWAGTPPIAERRKTTSMKCSAFRSRRSNKSLPQDARVSWQFGTSRFFDEWHIHPAAKENRMLPTNVADPVFNSGADDYEVDSTRRRLLLAKTWARPA